MLQIHGRFAGPAAVGIAFNFGIIVGVLVGKDSIGIEAAGWGVVVGATLQVILQLPQFWRLLREAHARPVLGHPRLAAVGLLALPVLGASVLQQVNNFTDKLFASSLEAGRVSALSFANALGQAPRAALLLPLLTPLFPLIARLMSERREEEALARLPARGGPAGAGRDPDDRCCWRSTPTRSPSSPSSARPAARSCVAQIAPPLVWYALGIWPAFLSLLLNRTLSAANFQRDILWTTVVTVVLTIVLDLILLGPMEQAGPGAGRDDRRLRQRRDAARAPAPPLPAPVACASSAARQVRVLLAAGAAARSPPCCSTWPSPPTTWPRSRCAAAGR